eukprot:scaffold117521_cov38-Prasinocladus_malaysianus.AAC.1
MPAISATAVAKTVCMSIFEWAVRLELIISLRTAKCSGYSPPKKNISRLQACQLLTVCCPILYSTKMVRQSPAAICRTDDAAEILHHAHCVLPVGLARSSDRLGNDPTRAPLTARLSTRRQCRLNL